MLARSFFQYLHQVRQEFRRITWPSNRETLITTLMVLVMVTLAAVFFLGVDAVLHWLVAQVLLV